MRISEKMRQLLIEVFEEKYEHNRQRLSMDGLRIHYDDWQIQEMKEQQKFIKELLDELRKEDK